MPGAPGALPQAQGHYSINDLERLWVQAGGTSKMAPVMAAIAMAESGGNTNAHNASGASGLWQIMLPVNSKYVPGGASAVYNPLANATAAVAILKSQGLGAWTTYTSGAYKQFLGSAQATQTSNANLGNDPVSGAVGTVTGAVGSVTGAFSSIGDLVGMLTSGAFWLRVGEVIAGGLLILLGLHALTGGSGTPAGVVTAVAKHV